MELKKLMQDAGIVGAGGAGFPSYAKISGGADTLLINGSECEPLIYTDYVILKKELSTVLYGAALIMEKASIKRAVLAIKAHTAKRLSFSDGDTLEGKITVKVLPDVYPIGDEISLIYEALGKVVRPGNLPITKGIIVYNVETLYNLGRTEKYGDPVTKKWLTVGGDVDNASVVRAPIGTRVSDLFKKLNINIPEECAVIDGGPSMGKVIDPDTATVTKTTNALLILPKSSQAVTSKTVNEKMATARAETACCQCTRCTDMCPRALLGYPLEPHKMVRTAMGAVVTLPEMVISATLCCGCGICESIACSQGISPRAVISNYKALLSKNKMRYTSDGDVTPDAQRNYRMVPSDRWASTLGIKKFDKPVNDFFEIVGIKRVEIPLAGHIGAPSIPTVKDGDTVEAGELIARAADGLSVPQHASVFGKVRVMSDRIIIESEY